MDFSKLGQNEKLAAYGAVASIVGAILTTVGYAAGAGGLWLTFILAIAMLAIVFMPQWSPQTALPGSKGSLMLVVGGVAALGALLGLLGLLGFLAVLGGFAGFFLIPLLGLIIGIIGGFLMGWAGWQEFQAEGGKFQIGNQSTGGAASVSAPPPPASPAAPATPAPPATSTPPARDEDAN